MREGRADGGTPPRREPVGRGRVASLVAVTAVAAGLAGLAAGMLAGPPGRPSAAAARPGGQRPVASAELTARSGAVSLPAPVRCRGCWLPHRKESWQIQLSATPSRPFPDVQMIEVDGFDTPSATVAALRRARRGTGVVCYIDAGTWENWRPDAKEFPRDLLGKKDGAWAGERWLDIARFHGALGKIMRARAAMCKAKGFNAIDFDNVDGYTNDTGFKLTAADQLRYDVFLANTAHRLGLSVALKNDLAQIPVLLRYFDFAVDEQCFQYRECLSSQNGGFGLDEFTRAHKAVFDIEYRLKRDQFCPAAIRDHFNALRKRLSLGAWREPCG